MVNVGYGFSNIMNLRRNFLRNYNTISFNRLNKTFDNWRIMTIFAVQYFFRGIAPYILAQSQSESPPRHMNELK